MKALRFILPLAMVFGFTLTSTAQTSKMGLVDYQAIITDMPEYATAEQKLITRQQDKQSEINLIYQQIMIKSQEYEELRTSGTLTSGAAQLMEEELYDLQEKYTRAEQLAQQSIIDYEEILMEPVIEKADGAIDAVAKANGYTHVSDVNTFIVYPEGDDITGKVKAHLGIQ